jgi:hypothetical protein
LFAEDFSSGKSNSSSNSYSESLDEDNEREMDSCRPNMFLAKSSQNTSTDVFTEKVN